MSFDGGAYYAAKAAVGYEDGVVDAVGMPDIDSNLQVQWYNKTDDENVDGVPVGQSWLFKTDCHKAIEDGAGTATQYVCNFPRSSVNTCNSGDALTEIETCDTGWCDGMDVDEGTSTAAGASPAVCTDSPSWVNPGSTNSDDDVFTNLELTGDGDQSFATAVVLVNVDFGGLQDEQTEQTTGPVDNAVEGYWTGNGTNTVSMTAYEQDKIMYCRTGSEIYTYGSKAAASLSGDLKATDTVQFTSCVLPQQLKTCCADPGRCCDVFGSANNFASCCYHASDAALVCDTAGECAAYNVDLTRNSNARVFRPFSTYFTAMSSTVTDQLACDDADDGKSCCFFNGTTVAPDAGETLFVYEPNPYVNSEQRKLGVPVVFNLLNSADGGDPAVNSWLSQFIAGGSASYTLQAGWKALTAFYPRLSGMLSGPNPAYDTFVDLYFSYTVVQVFLLQFYQLAAVRSSLLYETPSFLLFISDDSWASSVAGIWESLNSASFLSALVTSDVFGKPTVGKIDENNEIEVSIWVPALLRSWATESKIGHLLVRMFPETSNDDETFLVPSAFSVDAAYDIIESGEAELDSPFSVVAGSLSREDYRITGDDLTPHAGDTGALVASKATFKVSVLTESVTLLFYLFYKQAHGSIDTMTNFTLPSEPQIIANPQVLNWTSACNITQRLGGCDVRGYSGTGSSNVNAWFVNEDSAVCKCVGGANLLDLGDSLLYRNEAMCFNNYCTSSSSMAVDLNSLLVNSSTGTCPVPAKATVEVTNGAVTGLDIYDAGSGYDPENPPTVSLVGSRGTGAEITVSVTSAGTLALDEVVSGGSGYDQETPDVYFVVEELPTTETYDCGGECPGYINYLSEFTVDYTAVNLSRLASLCDYDFTTFQKGLDSQTAFVASTCLILLTIPAFVLIAVLCMKLGPMKDGYVDYVNDAGQEVRVKPVDPDGFSFKLGIGIAAFLVLVGVIYFWVDVRGTQHCSGTLVSTDGYYSPASTCQNNQMSIGDSLSVPAYTLPQDFCAAPQSYCQCDEVQGMSCAASSSCGCTDVEKCCSSTGVCAAEDVVDEPYSGQQVEAVPYHEYWTWRDLVFSTSLCVFLLVTTITAFWLGTPSFTGKTVAAVGIGAVAAVVSYIPMLLRYLSSSFNLAYTVRHAPCVALSSYPVTLTSEDKTLTTTNPTDDDAAPPTYTDGSSTVAYVDGAWTLTDADGQAWSNYAGSGAIYAPSFESSIATLFKKFTRNGEVVTFCGATAVASTC